MALTSNSEIDICPVCDMHNKQIPLIHTFKFPDAELWCPCCGYTCGIFGDTITVTKTTVLTQLKEHYREKAKSFLSGKTEEWNYETENKES